jgi:hypothetical protein
MRRPATSRLLVRIGGPTNDEPWYGAKCIFLHTGSESRPEQVYEERVILLRAESLDDAVARAEVMAGEYASDLEGCSYLGFVDVFHIFDENVGDGTEVYSLMRASELGRDEYLNRFHDSGTERTQK